MELGPESSGCGATALFGTRIVVLDDCAYAQREQDAARTTPLTSWRVEPTAIVEPLPGVMTKLCKPIHTHEAGNREASTGVTETSREQQKILRNLPLEWATRLNFFELQLFYTHQWFLFPN
jgi:hypothetical protein